MNLKVTKGKLLILPEKETNEETTKGGIIMPGVKSNQVSGTVAYSDIHNEIAVNDVVYFHKSEAKEFMFESQMYYVIDCEKILTYSPCK